MVVKYKRPDGTGRAIVRPYTRADRLYMEEMLARDHGGPYTMIHSRPRSAAPAASASTNAKPGGEPTPIRAPEELTMGITP